MADVILNRRQIQLMLEGGQMNAPCSSYKDSAFLPVTLVIDVIEKEKKGGDKMPSELKRAMAEFPKYVPVIPLSPHGLFEAMNDPDFADKYTNRCGNPIEMSTEASAYECDGWWDRTEFLNSFMEVSWI